MKQITALAMKDLKVLVRDKAGFFFTFFFPLVYATFFGAIFSSGGSSSSAMGVLIVDEDRSEVSAAFASTLAESAELTVTEVQRDEARDRVRRGRSVAYVALPEGFGGEWNQMFQGELTVEVGVDPRRKAELGMLIAVLNQYSAERLQMVMGGAGGGSTFQPIHIRDEQITVQQRGPNNAYAISFPQGIVWGIMTGAAGFGISIVIERTRGTLVRLRMAPVRRSQILGGKALACFTTTMGISIVLLAVAILVFGVRPNSLPMLFLAVLCSCLCFVGIMMLLAVMGKTEQSAGGIGWAILLVMAMIGGGMIPLFIMPGWMQRVSDVSVIKWAILAMEGAIWRGFTFQEMLLPCGILVGVGVVTFVTGVRTFKWTEA